jgi:hypothetical protein
MTRSTVLLVLLLALTLGSRCRPSAPPEPGATIAVSGRIESGVECPMLNARDGRRYALAGPLGRFGIGDDVCVRGTIAEVSYCMAGDAVIAVSVVSPPDSCPGR